MVFIDGSHKLATVAADIRNLRAASTCGAPIFMDDLDGEPGLALKEAAAAGHVRVHHWVQYDSRDAAEIARDARAGVARDGNITLYVPDRQRVYNPCLRFYWHARAVGLECHLRWDAYKCRSCAPRFEWGVAAYTSCAHGGGGGARDAHEPGRSGGAATGAPGP